MPKDIRTVTDVSADTGYYGGDAVTEIESENDLTAYVAVEKQSHHKTVKDLEEHNDPPEPDEDASITEKMRNRLKTKKGKDRYKLRKQTVEPVFGTIKETIGFRHFHLRGLEKVNIE